MIQVKIQNPSKMTTFLKFLVTNEHTNGESKLFFKRKTKFSEV